jgi:glycogenin glucosyltransferase
LDADCVVLRSIDDLFEREELSAAPDAGWPDCFNSGVFVYRPSKETFRKLMVFASQQNASFDGLFFPFFFDLFLSILFSRW